MRSVPRMLGVGAAVLVVGLFAWRVVSVRTTQAQSALQVRLDPVPVRVASVARMDLPERVSFTGVIRPRNEVDLFTRVPGRVESVAVAVGDRVEAGQPLAVIEHREIALQHRQASAQVKAARAAVMHARHQLAMARKQYERTRLLRKAGALPDADLERVESAYRAARAGLRAALAQLEVGTAAQGLAGEALRNSTLTSPIAGTVTRRSTNVGAQASPAQPLFQVQDVAVLKLEGSVGAADFLRLAPGQPVEVRVEDLPGARFPGRVAALSPSLDPQTRRAAVEVTLDNAEGRLLPNMFAQAQVDVGTRKGVLAIPSAAVVSLPTGKVVFVARGGKAVQVRPALTAGDGEHVCIESGLAEGDAVVTVGQSGLSHDMPIHIASQQAAQGRGDLPPRGPAP